MREKIEITYKLVAPDVDALLRHFDRGFRNSEKPSAELMSAMDPLFEALRPLTPCQANDEAKIIWIVVPVGELSDYGSFEEAKEYGEVETEEEFEEQWHEEYPDEVKWYRLTIGESKPEPSEKTEIEKIDYITMLEELEFK